MDVSVTQEISPIKFCFLFKPGDKACFEECVRSSNSLWGGTSNPIFPLYKRFPRRLRRKWHISNSVKDFYGNYLSNHDVDVVIYQDELDEDHVNSVAGDLKTINLSTFKDELHRLSLSHGIPITALIFELVDQEFKYRRGDGLNFLLPEYPDNIYEIILHHIPNRNIHNAIRAFFRDSKYVKSIKTSEEQYVNSLTIKDFTLREILDYKLRYFPEGHSNTWILFFNPEDLDDLLALWNIRATGQKILAVDRRVFFDGRYDSTIAPLYRDNNSHPVLLKAPSAEITDLTLFSRYLKNILPTYEAVYQPWLQDWFPRFGSSKDIMKSDGVAVSNKLHNHKYGSYQFKEEYLTFPCIELKLQSTKGLWGKLFKNRFSISYYDSKKEYAGTVVDISKKQWAKVVDSFQVNEFRVSEGSLVKLCRLEEMDISFKPPKAFKYLQEYFLNYNVEIELNPGAHLSHQIFKNLEGNHGLYMFDSVGAVNVLKELEGGKPLLHNRLYSTIKGHKPRQFEDRPGDYIAGLIEHKIVEFGSQLKCSVCGQHSFYKLNDLNERLICKHCSSSFEPSLSNPKDTFKWSYKGVGPFSKNNRVDGMIPGFLTLRLIDYKFASADRSTVLMNFDIQHKEQKFEVDLYAQLRKENRGISQVETFFCECKSFKRIQNRDIDRLKYLGELFPGSILVFSTLNDSLNEDEINLLRQLVNHFRTGMGNRPRNHVLILTANELLPEDLYFPFRNIEVGIEMNMHTRSISARCDQSVVRYLNLESWGEISHRRWADYHQKMRRANATS